MILKVLMKLKIMLINQLNTFWDSYKRFSNPKKYKVDLSDKLWTLKSELLDSKKTLII